MPRLVDPPLAGQRPAEVIPLHPQHPVTVDEVRQVVDRIVGINDLVPAPLPLRARKTFSETGRKIIRSGRELYLAKG